jgi:hypothetical protein
MKLPRGGSDGGRRCGHHIDSPAAIESSPAPDTSDEFHPSVAAVERSSRPATRVRRISHSCSHRRSASLRATAGRAVGQRVGALAAMGGSGRSRAVDGACGHRGAEPAGSLDRGRRGRGHVWAEGFGWRDVVTQTPVTTDTRFNIGTAAPVVAAAAVASLGMTNTGTDSAAEWSPGRLMYMRDLACCAGRMAFYSTPSDLVRFALATKADSVNGQLAGGSVMSLSTRRDNGIVVAVESNVAHANTAALALKVADVFAEQK